MITLKLAIRNLMGAGLRTWLNVSVLAISFIFIIWMQGLMEGWKQQARHDTIEWQIGGGQIWHENYDRFDAMQLVDSHAVPAEQLQDGVNSGNLTAVLMSQASIYPDGRMRGAILRGIEARQNILALPTEVFAGATDVELPVLIGTSMARSTGLRIGDTFAIRWQDANNTFDAFLSLQMDQNRRRPRRPLRPFPSQTLHCRYLHLLTAATQLATPQPLPNPP